MNNFLLISTLLLLTLANCKTTQKPVEEPVQTPQEEIKQELNAVDEDIFLKAREGFISPSTFQVVVSSLKEDAEEGRREAIKVAQKKALNLLQKEAKPGISSDGKKDLEELSSTGKVQKISPKLYGQFYYIYQIEKPGLETFVKSKVQ